MDTSATPVDPASSPRSSPQIRAVLICDVADSTALVERLGDAAAAELMRRHDRLARDLLHAHGGREIDKTDGFLMLFPRPVQAVAFALAYQRMLRGLGQEIHETLRARIGLHVGEVVLWDNVAADIADGAKPVEVEGLAKPVAARLMGLAQPGQILLSETARSLAQRAQAELAEGDRVRWLAHGRYAFKGVPAPMLVHEVGETGIAPLSPPSSGPKAWRDLPWWRRPAALALEAVLLVAVIAVPIYLSLRTQPAIAFAERDWVVLGDLRNLTAEPLFNDALDEAFRIGLEQSRYVNVVPALRAREALRRMQREPGAALSREVAIELALREGARAVILPTVTELGGRVRISAEVVDPNSGATVYAESADGQGAESVLPAMDAVIGSLRERLGESIKSIELASAPLARITTSSLDALRAFALAEQAVGEGNIPQAISLLEQAVALDPGFAMAYGRLATISHGKGDTARAFELGTRALQDPDKLSAREKMLLEATISFFASPAETRERWLALERVYPDVHVAEYNAGLAALWFHNDAARAAEHFRRFEQSDHPLRAFGWLGLAVAQTALGDAGQGADSARKAESFGLRPPAFENVLADIAARRRDDALSRLNQGADTWGAATQAERALRLAAIELDRGDPAAARRVLEDAMQEADPSLAASIRGRFELGLAVTAIALGRGPNEDGLGDFIERGLAAAAARTTSFDHAALAQLLAAAILAAERGSTGLATRVRDDLAASIRPLRAPQLDRLLAVLECSVAPGARSAGIACLRDQIDGTEFVLTRALLARRLRELGEHAAADEQARWLVEHRGRALTEMQRFDTQLLNLAELNRAELDLIEHAKDAEEAARRRSALLRAWDGAAADSPYLERLRRLAPGQASDQQDD